MAPPTAANRFARDCLGEIGNGSLGRGQHHAMAGDELQRIRQRFHTLARRGLLPPRRSILHIAIEPGEHLVEGMLHRLAREVRVDSKGNITSRAVPPVPRTASYS